MKTLDLLLIAIILASFSPCAIELARFSTPHDSKVVQGKILSIHSETIGGRRRGVTNVTVDYEYKAEDGFVRHGSAASIPCWIGAANLNPPFTEESRVLVEYDASNPSTSVCSGIGWAFSGLHLVDGLLLSVVATISLTLKGMMGSTEATAQQIARNNRRDSRFSS